MNERVLFIVDIQGFYSNHYNKHYVEKVKRYLLRNSFEKVYGLIDLNADEIANENIECIFNGDYIPKDLTTLINVYLFKEYSDLAYEVMDAYHLRGKEQEINDKGLYHFKDGVIMSWEDKEFHGLYSRKVLTKEMFQELLKLKFENKEVVLIGGGINNCIKITKHILDTLQIKNRILPFYCYSINDKLDETYEDSYWLYVKNTRNSSYYKIYDSIREYYEKECC